MASIISWFLCQWFLIKIYACIINLIVSHIEHTIFDDRCKEIIEVVKRTFEKKKNELIKSFKDAKAKHKTLTKCLNKANAFQQKLDKLKVKCKIITPMQMLAILIGIL